MQIPQGQTVTLDSNDLPRFVCKDCGGETFQQVVLVVEIPFIYRAAFNNADRMNVPVYQCTDRDCGAVNDPNELVKAPSRNKSKLVVVK